MSIVIYSLNSPQKVFIFKGSELPGQVGKIINNTRYIEDSNKKGFLSYGPYVELEDGKYTFTITYSSHKAKGCKFDIVTNVGKVTKAKDKLSEESNKTNCKRTINIINKYDNNKIEVRVWYGSKGTLTLHSIKIEKHFSYHDMLQILQFFIILFIVFILFFIGYKYSKKATLFTILLIVLIILSFAIDAYSNYYTNSNH